MKQNKSVLIMFLSFILSFFFLSGELFAYKKSDLKKLRDTKKCIKCDLSGANLQFTNLSGANLQFTNLSGANLNKANLNKANLDKANLARNVFFDLIQIVCRGGGKNERLPTKLRSLYWSNYVFPTTVDGFRIPKERPCFGGHQNIEMCSLVSE